MSRKIYIIIAMVFTVVLSVSTFFIIRNHIDSAKQNEVYDNLEEIVQDEPPKENEGVTFSEDKDYLAEYFELYRQNEDIDFSAHFLLPFHIISLSWSQISAILRIPQLDTLHKIQSIFLCDGYFRRNENEHRKDV